MKVAVTVLVSCVAALLALGMVMLYSSSMAQVGERYLFTQLVWCALGLLLCAAATLIDYRWLKHWAGPLLVVTLVLLVLVLVPRFSRPISGALLLVAGVRWKYIVPTVLLAVVAIGLSLWHDPMRSKRIFAWLNPEENKSGVGYQSYEAMLALGAGGLTGLGLGNGRQKLGFVPEHHTDFILSIIGEELGLVATLLIVAGFVVIVICGICIALNAPDTFGLLLGSGVAFLIGLQALINIGVVTSALPNKGLPLPFISYGGSNLLIMLTSVGLLLSIARRARGTESLDGAGAGESEPENQR